MPVPTPLTTNITNPAILKLLSGTTEATGTCLAFLFDFIKFAFRVILAFLGLYAIGIVTFIIYMVSTSLAQGLMECWSRKYGKKEIEVIDLVEDSEEELKKKEVKKKQREEKALKRKWRKEKELKERKAREKKRRMWQSGVPLLHRRIQELRIPEY